jgi:hypothetical protein
MASRDTEEEAVELKAKTEKDFPDLKIVIDHQEGEGPVFPGAIEAQNLTVSRWEGETPYVKWEKWHVRELVTCRECSNQWSTDAIGEDSTICIDCLRIARDSRTDAQVREDTANEMARDLHREWWCQQEMYNESLVTIRLAKDGNFGIKTPFNADFKDELKALIPSAKWQSPCWIIKASGKEQAKQLLAKYFPPENELQKVRIEWDLNRESPEIDGIGLANISRDWWGWRKDCPIDFKIIEQNLDSGGSRKNPGLYGQLVIEVAIRPGADISPSAEVTVIEDGEKANPLAGYSTEDLLAELEARGVK